jgi:hypothetical protein
MATEALAIASFLDKLLQIYKNKDNFTNVPPRTLSIEATVRVLELYANICKVPLGPALHDEIENVLESFRRQWLKECPHENNEGALVKLFDTPQCKHRMYVSRCMTMRR